MSQDLDGTTAESSTANIPAGLPSLESLSSSERETWRLKGELPASPKTSADSSPADPAAPGAATAASSSSDSDSDTSAESSADAPKYKEKTAKRMQELLAERDQARRDREAMEQRLDAVLRRMPAATDALPAVPSPAPQSFDRLLVDPLSQPFLEDAPFYELFPEATPGQYQRYIARYETLRTQHDQAIVQTSVQEATTFKARIDKAVEADPNFWTDMPSALLTAVPARRLPPGVPAGPDSLLVDELFDSPKAPELMTYLKQHPDALTNLRQCTTPLAMARAVGRLEATLASVVPPPPTVASAPSSAPPPPATVRGVKHAPVNDLDQALRDRDFTRYRDLANARDLADQPKAQPLR